jgi:alanyl-tRNA synthetase
VRFVDEEVRHYGKLTEQPLDDVTCKIDSNRRLLNAKYHTAGHLVAGCLENAHSQMIATKCHAFPGEAYVEFQGASDLYPNVKRIGGRSIEAQAQSCTRRTVQAEHRNDEPTNFLRLGIQLQSIQELVNQLIQQKIQTKVFEIDLSSFENKYYKLPYPVPANKPFRVLQIGDYKPVPCGGTHLSNTSEIGSILIKKVKTKDGVLKISYEICEPH